VGTRTLPAAKAVHARIEYDKMLEDMANVEDFAHFLGMDGVFVMHLLEAQSNIMVASAGSPRLVLLVHDSVFICSARQGIRGLRQERGLNPGRSQNARAFQPIHLLFNHPQPYIHIHLSCCRPSVVIVIQLITAYSLPSIIHLH